MDLKVLEEQLEGILQRKGFQRTVKGNMAGSTVGSPAQGMQERLRGLLQAVLPDHDLSRLAKMDVGDSTLVSPETGYDIGLSLPVASDLWYLFVGRSLLPFQGDNYQENATKILGFLTEYLEKLDNIKPLHSIQSYKDLHLYMNWAEMRGIWDSEKAPSVIREARFETWMQNRSTQFPSPGPSASLSPGVRSQPNTSLGQLYAGLMSFPVGPMGVMEVLSIFSESMIQMVKDNIPIIQSAIANEADNSGSSEGLKISWPTGWRCVTEQVLDGFMSPMTDMQGKCPGVHLLEKGYVLVNGDTEYPGEEFAGYGTEKPLRGLRYYFRREAKWPLPGEFIGLLAKPWPSHVWWFQMTSPILYAGNWFETNHYTSGVITEILEPPEGSLGRAYRCVVRGVEVCIASSDFFGYAVGDRVAIIRLNDLDRFLDNTRGNFKWTEMEDLIAREKWEKETPSNLPYVLNPNMMIVPMSFYKP